MRGSWIDLEFDPKDILNVRIDRRRKFPVTLLLKALGYTTENLLQTFYRCAEIRVEEGIIYKLFDQDILFGSKASEDIVDPQTGEVIVQKDKKITKVAIKRMQSAGITRLQAEFSEIEGHTLCRDVIHPETGEVLAEANDQLTEEKFAQFMNSGIMEFGLIYINEETGNTTIRDTLILDKVKDRDEAIVELYRKLRPSNPPTQEIALKFFNSLFFDPEHYDLSAVGRMKLNQRLDIEGVPVDHKTLRPEDILLAIEKLIELKVSEGPPDDIDHLGNRRVRAVGELLESQYRVGLVRMERAIKERMSLGEIETLMPHDLINPKPVSAVVKEFFGTSQLSQFMDQTNPLSEVTHKRRLSALGPGGLTRERAGFRSARRASIPLRANMSH